MLLTDEEIALAIDKANGGKEWREGWKLTDVIEEQDRSIAKAQLKQVVDIMSRHRVYLLSTEETKYVGLMPDEEWQSLVREVE